MTSYGESNYQTGKVLTATGEKADIIARGGFVKTTSKTAVGAPFSLFLTRPIATLTLVYPTVIDTYIIQIVSDSLPVVGNVVCLKEGTRFFQATVLTVTPTGGDAYTLALDSPIDHTFSVAGGCSLNSRNMAVNGSVDPVSFVVSPQGLNIGTIWDIHGFSVHMIDDAAMDDTKFGGLAKLVRGLVARGRNGRYTTLGNFKRNADFALAGFTSYYREKTGGGEYSFSASLDLRRYGTSIDIIVDDKPDFFEGIVQDNLTGMTSLEVTIHGHIEVL